MDVKRVESIAVPTTLAAVGGGLFGYMIPRMTKDGNMADEFLKFVVDADNKADEKALKMANSLDNIKFEPTEEEIKNVIGDNNIHEMENKLSDEKSNLSKEEKDTLSKEIKGLKTKLETLKKETKTRGNKQLESFVRRNSKVFGIERAEGQSLDDAVKAFIGEKSVKDIKTAFLEKSIKKSQKRNYASIIKKSFEKVFDSKTKAFKKDADKDTVKMFKRYARNMKLKAAAKLAAITGAIALISAISANIANKISNR